MKNIVSGLLGLTLTLGTAGLTFAAQDTTAPKSTDSTTTTPKKVKKHKKAAKPAAPATAPAASTPPAAK